MFSAEAVAVIEACSAGSLAGTIPFPEVVSRLMAVGVERYHADLCRGEITHYVPSGDSYVVTVLGTAEGDIADAFAANQVQTAIRASQRAEIRFPEFLTRIMAAGCIGYFVHLSGRNALYFGRKGELHIEPFPKP